MESHTDHNHRHTVSNLKVAFWLNTVFSVIEVVGGIMTNSLAILSDAFHDLGDAVALGMAWYFQRVSARSSDSIYTYGYKRYSLAGAVVSGMILFSGSVIIIIHAIPRLLHPQPVNSGGMMILAVAGIIINGIAALRMRNGHNLNEKIISLHLLEDVLGWAAVLAAGIIMQFFDVPVLDPLLSIGIIVFILYRLFGNMKQVFSIFMQAVPSAVSAESLKAGLLALQGVEDVHDLHFWSMDGDYNVASVHLAISPQSDMTAVEDIRNKAREFLKSKGYLHATIEIEPSSKHCEFENC